MKKYVIKKSLYPEGNKTHIVNGRALSKYGVSEGRVFKGTYEECKKFIQRKDKEKSVL